MLSDEDRAKARVTQQEARARLDEWLQAQEGEYRRARPALDHFSKEFAATIQAIMFGSAAANAALRRGGPEVATVKPDVKDWGPSLVAKLERGLKWWDQCPDLVRFRVVVKHASLVPAVVEALLPLTKAGSVDSKHWWRSEGSGKGYAAVHLQLVPPMPMANVLPLALRDASEGGKDIGVEVQIHTKMQAAWSDIAHEHYKAEHGSSARVRTGLFRLAAALEMLDDQIEQTMLEHLSAEAQAHEQLERSFDSTPLDEVTLLVAASGRLEPDLAALRGWGRRLEFRESAWAENVRGGRELSDFVEFAASHGVDTMGALSVMFDCYGEAESSCRRFVELEMQRVDRIEEFVTMNRPLFVLSLAMAFRQPDRGLPRMRPGMLSSFYQALVEEFDA